MVNSADPDGAPRRGSELRRWLPIVSALLAVLPVAVATTRAVARDWEPVGDNGLITIRAHDVFTEHHPLLGTWSSASLATGTELHNPGPLSFDLLALPVRIFGHTGVALAVGVVNALAVIGIVIVAHRRGGPLLASAAALVTAALSWVMGSQLLVEPWQPHSMLLPFLCFLFLGWTVTCGDLPALPWAAAVGSLVLQTHLTYGLMVPAVGLWAAVGLVLALRRQQSVTGTREVRRRRTRRWVSATGLVLVLCWAQPLVQQVTSDGPGNLSRLVATVGGDDDTTGLTLSARLVASVVATPPWWSRSSFEQAWTATPGDYRPEAADLPSAGAAVASLATLVLALAVGGWVAHRHQDREASSAAVGAIVALLAGLVTAASVPLGDFGIAAHQFRWLWPLSAFVGFALLAVVVRRLGGGTMSPRGLIGAFTALTALLAVLNLPPGPPSPSSPSGSMAVARGLNRQLGVLEGKGPVLVRLPRAFNDPYGGAVMAELARRDIPFLVVPEWTPHLGAERRFDGDNARSTLTFGAAAQPAPPGGRRVAEFEGVALFLAPAADR